MSRDTYNAFFSWKGGYMWNLEWIKEWPVGIKALIFLSGFFFVICSLFMEKSEELKEESNDNSELLDEKSKR